MRVHKLVTRPTSWGFSESKRDGIEYAALALQTRYARDLAHAPGGAPAIQENDDVDGLGNQRARRLAGGFERELFQAQQRAVGGIGVQRGDAARMAGDRKSTRLNSSH